MIDHCKFVHGETSRSFAVLPDCGCLCLQCSDGAKMQNTVTSVLGFLMLFSSASQQERPRELKGAGHLLGETAEHFFSEDAVGQLLRACKAGDWKAVKQLA
jgi:hypothetical protein